MKVYYAHSIALYGTPTEVRDIALLTRLGFEVVNPNKPEHDAGYQKYGMHHFEDVLDECDALAFRANPDSSINAGVMWEIKYMQSLDRPVFEVPSNMDRRTLTVDQTRAYLKECGAR